jgi:hypothetical protein
MNPLTRRQDDTSLNLPFIVASSPPSPAGWMAQFE